VPLTLSEHTAIGIESLVSLHYYNGTSSLISGFIFTAASSTSCQQPLYFIFIARTARSAIDISDFELRHVLISLVSLIDARQIPGSCTSVMRQQ
jgi:hypothetical protein